LAVDPLSVRVTSRPRAGGRLPGAERWAESEPVLPLLAGLAFMGGLIHVGAAVDHAAEVPAYTPAFLAVAAGQFVWSWLLWRGPSRTTMLAGAALSVAVLLVWLASRTVGVPFGPRPWVPESVGAADVIESADELMAALVAVPLALSGTRATARRSLRVAGPAIVLLLVLSALYGVGAHAG
jgi:hypothetical protein